MFGHKTWRKKQISSAQTSAALFHETNICRFDQSRRPGVGFADDGLFGIELAVR